MTDTPSITDRIVKAIHNDDVQTLSAIISDRQILTAPLWAFIGLELEDLKSNHNTVLMATRIFRQTVWEWANECVVNNTKAPEQLEELLDHHMLNCLSDCHPKHDNWIAIFDHVFEGAWDMEEIITPLTFSWTVDNNNTIFEQALHHPRFGPMIHRHKERFCLGIVQEQALSMARTVLQWAVDNNSFTVGQTWINSLCSQALNHAWGPLSNDLTHPSPILDLVEHIEQYSGNAFDWEKRIPDVPPYAACNIITSPKIAKALEHPEILHETLRRWLNTDYMESISYQSLAQNPDYLPSAQVIDSLWMRLPASDRLSICLPLLGKSTSTSKGVVWEAHEDDWNEESIKYVDHLCQMLSWDELQEGWKGLQSHPPSAIALWDDRPLIQSLKLNVVLHEELDHTQAPIRSKKM